MPRIQDVFERQWRERLERERREQLERAEQRARELMNRRMDDQTGQMYVYRPATAAGYEALFTPLTVEPLIGTNAVFTREYHVTWEGDTGDTHNTWEEDMENTIEQTEEQDASNYEAECAHDPPCDLWVNPKGSVYLCQMHANHLANTLRILRAKVAPYNAGLRPLLPNRAPIERTRVYITNMEAEVARRAE